MTGNAKEAGKVTTTERIANLEAQVDETTATLDATVQGAIDILQRIRAGKLTDPNRIDIEIGDLVLNHVGAAWTSNAKARGLTRALRVAR